MNKDDFVAFHNSAAHVPGSSRRPYVGRVINFFETSSGECIVKVSWFYRTEETKQGLERTLPKVGHPRAENVRCFLVQRTNIGASKFFTEDRCHSRD